MTPWKQAFSVQFITVVLAGLKFSEALLNSEGSKYIRGTDLLHFEPFPNK